MSTADEETPGDQLDGVLATVEERTRSVRAITKKDYRDAIRSPYFWAVALAITLLVGFVLFQVVQQLMDFIAQAEQQTGQQNLEQELTTGVFIQVLRFGFQVLIPILAIVVTYVSVAGERDSGAIKLLLALPHSRRDVLLGKLLGRMGVVATPLALAFVVGAIAFPLSPFTFKPVQYLWFVVLTLMLGLVFVGVGLGFSAAASSSRRAAIGSFGVYAYLVLLWNGLAQNLPNLLSDALDWGRALTLQVEVLIRVLNPMAAYRSLVYSKRLEGAPMEARAILIQRGGQSADATEAQQAVGATTEARQFLLRNVFVDQVPWYFSDPMVIGYLLLWLVVPLLVGYVLFTRADL